MTDHILINDLRVNALIGVLGHERLAPQPLRIDVDIEVDLSEAGRTDDLACTVHYGDVAVALAELARTTDHLLLERLAERMTEVVLAFPLVRAVELTLTKLQPPIDENIHSTAVRLRRDNRGQVSADPGGHRAFVALGSNLGDREANLRFAVARLGDLVVRMSQVYETAPVGGPDDQGAYLNMVAEIRTTLDPYALMRLLHRIEADAGRERLVHWGPRTLDLDLIVYDDVSISGGGEGALTVPHPRYAQRRFVLAPLGELDPTLCPPDWETTLPPDEVRPCGRLPE